MCPAICVALSHACVGMLDNKGLFERNPEAQSVGDFKRVVAKEDFYDTILVIHLAGGHNKARTLNSAVMSSLC